MLIREVEIEESRTGFGVYVHNLPPKVERLKNTPIIYEEDFTNVRKIHRVS